MPSQVEVTYSNGPGSLEWAEANLRAGGIDFEEVWRPNDWPEVEAIVDAPTETRR